MTRITVEMVLGAYKKTGLIPIQGMFCDRNTACARGAIALAESKNDLMDGLEITKRRLGLTTSYLCGFTRGFDGVGLPTKESIFPDLDYSEIQLGCQDGQAAWEAVKPCR